jgi:hypothetical protein
MNNQPKLSPLHHVCRIIFMDGLWSVYFLNGFCEPVKSASHFASKVDALFFAIDLGFKNPEIVDY